MERINKYVFGVLLSLLLAILARSLAAIMPGGLISPGVIALLIGMLVNPYLGGRGKLGPGLNFVSKRILKLSIILMGATLSFVQLIEVGKYSLVVMAFTLSVAFGLGYLLGKLFKMDWKLSSLISVGTAICGGSAVATLAPTIDAKSKDIAYSISTIFIVDMLLLLIFPFMGKSLGMSDLGYGLWTGTAIHDTSSVVAAGYAFSDAAGNFSLIVKLTRTLSIIPIVLVFSLINARLEKGSDLGKKTRKIELGRIFPYFIVMFLLMVALKSTGLISDGLSSSISQISKFAMVMSLGAIGLSTSLEEISKSGILPLVHGFIISILVVIVSFLVQLGLGQV